jgi:hypothetical protein
MLATTTETALSTELAEAVGRARDFAKASKAHATRKAYAADLRDFTAYCQRIGALSLPADPAVVGTYLATISETKSVATIRSSRLAPTIARPRTPRICSRSTSRWAAGSCSPMRSSRPRCTRNVLATSPADRPSRSKRRANARCLPSPLRPESPSSRGACL